MDGVGKAGAGKGIRRYRMRAAGRIAIAALAVIGGGEVFADEDPNGAAGPALPNVYIDFRTNYATVPANSLALGIGNGSLFSSLSNIVRLVNPAAAPTTPVLPTSVSTPASQSAWIDVPLTVDVNDRLSLYGGITASTSNSGSGWSALDVTSWNVGLQADIFVQDGGYFPTVTLQTTLTRSAPDSPIAVTSLNNIVELGYALDEDETRGWLAGVQHTWVETDSQLIRFNDNIIGYVGGYYQWPNNWKFTGRVGVQSFGGAQFTRLVAFQPFPQPFVRLDPARMDDNDNRLFGVTAQISWVPKPSYTLTLRTPLYLVRN